MKTIATTDNLINIKPYELDSSEKRELFYEALLEEIKFHYDNNEQYNHFCKNKDFNPHDFHGSLEQIPPIAVSVFKDLGKNLKSIPDSEVKLSLQSWLLKQSNVRLIILICISLFVIETNFISRSSVLSLSKSINSVSSTLNSISIGSDSIISLTDESVNDSMLIIWFVPLWSNFIDLFFEISGYFQGGVIVVQIGLYLFTIAMIDDLPTHHSPRISLPVFGWNKITLHIMNTLANDYRDLIGPLV